LIEAVDKAVEFERVLLKLLFLEHNDTEMAMPDRGK
jgi:hypothetical protein